MRRTFVSRRHFMALSASVAALGAGAPHALAAQKVDLGVASIDPIYAPIYVALKNGYMSGVNYANVQSGPRAKQLLAAKQITAAVTGVNDSVALSVAGKQSVVVYGIDTRSALANIMVNRDVYESGVRTAKDLAGRSLGVTAPQAATWLMAVYITEKVGLKDKVQIKPMGDFSTMAAAVKSKAIDACIATFAMLEKGREEGWGVPLYNVSDDASWNEIFGGDLPGLGVYVLEETLKERPDDIQAMVTGLVRANDFIQSKTSEEVAALILPDYLNSFSMPSVTAAVTLFKRLWSKDNIISETSYARLAAIMGNGRMYSDKEMAEATYAKNIDMSFVRKARGV